MPKLNEDGCIPAHTKCPWWDECGLKEMCHHQGVKHDVPFSCGLARGWEMLERCKKNKK